MIRNLSRKISKKLGKKDFFGNIIALISGSVISQIITFFASLLLVKLYAPDEMGIYSNYTSILSVIAVITCLQYDRGIVLPDEDQDAKNLAGLCLLNAVGVSSLCAVIFLPFHKQIANYFNGLEFASWFCLMPASVLLAGILSILQHWNSRRKTLANVAVANTSVAVAASGSQIVLGLRPFHISGGMIVGNFFGRLFSSILLFRKTRNGEQKPLFSDISWCGIRKMAVRYRKFLASIPGGFCNNLCAALPALMLGYFFGPAETGYYSLGHRLLAFPLSIIGGSVGQAFFPEAKAAYCNHTLKALCIHIMNILLRLGCTPLLLLGMVAPMLISFIFGPEWYTAGEYIKWLSAWLLCGFVYSPFSYIFEVVERQEKYTMLNFINLFVHLIALLIGGNLKNPAITVAICGISGALISIFNCAYVLRLVHIKVSDILKCFALQIVHSLPYAIPTVICLIIWGQHLIPVIVAIASGCVFLLIEVKPIIQAIRKVENNDI